MLLDQWARSVQLDPLEQPGLMVVWAHKEQLDPLDQRGQLGQLVQLVLPDLMEL